MTNVVKTGSIGSVVALVAICLAGCGSGQTPPTASIPAAPGEPAAPQESQPEAIASEFPLTAEAERPRPYTRPEVIMETSLGNVRIRLHGQEVPETVDNFLDHYVDRGSYAGTIFHHADAGVVVAGGYTADMTPVEAFAPITNEAAQGSKNLRGTVAMVRAAEYSNSATSQFYFNLAADPTLDYDEASGNAGYCVFGEVVEGLEILDDISKAEVHEQDGFPSIPVTPVIVLSIKRILPEG